MANQIDALHAKIDSLTAKLYTKHDEALVRLDIFGEADPRTIKFFAKCSEIRRARDLAKRELRLAEKAARVQNTCQVCAGGGVCGNNTHNIGCS